MPRDYYVVPGVRRGADLSKIKKAYRTVVKKYHPDTAESRPSSEKFLEAKQAYETMSDEKSRRQYDRELERRQSGLRISKAPEMVRQESSVYNEMDSLTSAVEESIGACCRASFPIFSRKGGGKVKSFFSS